jgi:signal transduction histidine kinase
MLEAMQKPTMELGKNQQPKSILIVDDEVIIRDLCSKALKGYRVLQAADGEEALELFDQGGIDVILTDVMMPKLDGLELLKKLKEKEPTLVVIVMTGYADKDVILNALRADADDFITKPLSLLQLKTAVEKALVKKALKEEIANLKNLDRLKSNFLSMISHKFRTPITAISLFLQNLAAGVYDPDDPANQANLALIYEQSCYLGNLVTDLLTFSQVMDKGGSLNLEPCDVNSIIFNLLQSAKVLSGKHEIETVFDLEPLAHLFVDRDKLTFALKQIIDNAFKFSRDTGRITISIKAQGNVYRIIVEDTGVGIAKDELPKVFEKFYQVDTERTGQIRGFGLGLFYAKEFIKLHKGTITIDSELGKGTKVTITIPAAAGCPL